jgi:hypothetical protein
MCVSGGGVLFNVVEHRLKFIKIDGAVFVRVVPAAASTVGCSMPNNRGAHKAKTRANIAT